MGNWSFKFNSTDTSDNTAETYGGSHIVEEDTIDVIYISGNNSIINRSETQLFFYNLVN